MFGFTKYMYLYHLTCWCYVTYAVCVSELTKKQYMYFDSNITLKAKFILFLVNDILFSVTQ